MSFSTWWKEKRAIDRYRAKVRRRVKAKYRYEAEEKRRARIIRQDLAKQQAEEIYRQSIQQEAYLLWEADGRPDGKDKYYWLKAKELIELKNIPAIYKPYYLLEKRILEPSDAWISRRAFITILERLGNLALIVAVVSFVFSENIRHNNEVFAAWQTITSAQGQSGSGGRIEALEYLNSRPLRFPWIGWTEKDWFWDEPEQQCKLKRLLGLRWKRQPLVGLSAPNYAYLGNIHLCRADLRWANFQTANLHRANFQRATLHRANFQGAVIWKVNLQGADLQQANLEGAILKDANLQGADLRQTNLQGADLQQANLEGAILEGVSFQEADLVKEIKSACFWEQAIYHVAEWNKGKQSWVAKEPDNTNFVEKLKKDTASDPEEPIDCSFWKKEN